MARRESGFERKEREFYPTPGWVIRALDEVLPLIHLVVWEPACGTGEMAEEIRACGGAPIPTDIHDHGYKAMVGKHDFTSDHTPDFARNFDGIITNPPYGERCQLAEQFIVAGLNYIEQGGFLALLLPVDFNSAGTRSRFFNDCPLYVGKVVLTKRIKWFDTPVPCKPCSGTGSIGDGDCKACKGKGEKKSGPSENHAWFIWQRSWLRSPAPPREFFAPRRDA